MGRIAMSEKVIKQFESEMKDFKDRVAMLETKIRRLEKLPQELNELRKTIAKTLGISVETLDIDSTIRDVLFSADRIESDTIQKSLKMNLKKMKKYHESYQDPVFRNMVSEFMERWIAIVLLLVSFKQIGFNDFCSLIMENLGSDLAKKFITLEDVVKSFGAENATTWKRLIK